MFGAAIAVILVAAGVTLWSVSRLAGGSAQTAASMKIAGTVAALLGIALVFLQAFTVIDVGEVGVKHFLGSVDSRALRQGVHFINPFASIEKMSVREQNYPRDGSVEHMEAQTSEQLNVALEVALLYRLDGAKVPELFQRLGTQQQIENRIVLNAVRNGVRDAIATKSINEVFSPNRRELATAMKDAIQNKAGDRIEVLDVFVRDIQAPAKVKEAIEAKLQREQQVAAERFQTEIIQEKARQKVEEAKGIAEAQRIINKDLTDKYLVLRYIEALQGLPQGSLVIAPTTNGVPILMNPAAR